MQSRVEYLNELRLRLSFSQERMTSAGRESVNRRRRAFVGQAAALDALSPLKVLGRGYGFVTKEDQIVKTAGDLQTGDRIQVRLHQGEADCLVEAVRRRQNR